mmetsp:Transcript_11530/g.39764  ORF Transcript_11530/g.39764 Transcript_11530/m.39764 type:complete len:115 (+) Transcript_11530:8551-8895(+)
MEEARKTLQNSIEDKAGPLKLARTRLTVRTQKPDPETVRDKAERSLEKEVGDLEQAMRRLQIELRKQDADIQRLQHSQSQLEADLQDKTAALSIEQECEGLQRDLTKQMASRQS